MFHALKLSHVLQGVRPFALKGPKVTEGAAPPNGASQATSVEGGAPSGLGQDEGTEGALDRLLSRAELELSDPDAVQRRKIVAQLKLAAASVRAERDPEAPDSV